MRRRVVRRESGKSGRVPAWSAIAAKDAEVRSWRTDDTLISA
jgi:hypothetical protein